MRSPRRRRRCGAPFASWRSQAALAPSPPSHQAHISRPPVNVSRSSSAAATRPRSTSTSGAEPASVSVLLGGSRHHCEHVSRSVGRATAQFLLESICLNASAPGSPILQALDRSIMRALVVADLHYSLPQFDWLLAAAPEFDLVIFAGDA